MKAALADGHVGTRSAQELPGLGPGLGHLGRRATPAATCAAVARSTQPELAVSNSSDDRSAARRSTAANLLVSIRPGEWIRQEDVAERTLEMLMGAMDSLIVGDPALPSTDVGPVIDQPSYDKLMGRREAMKDRILKSIPVPAQGLFVPPTLIRLDRIEDLKEEWFGPLLHVTTWKGGELHIRHSGVK